jgi:DNA modification methylase
MNSLITIYEGNSLHMTEIPDESVQLIVTSPPYYWQRVYDVPEIKLGRKSDFRISRQFGMEKSPQLYIAHSMLFLKEMWRVLKKNGVLFYNLGDKFITTKGTCHNPGGGMDMPSAIAKKKEGVYPLDRGNIVEMRSYGLKPKDLALIPERWVLAAQAAGWTVRQDIIWEKENVAPESVKDRCPTVHEHIFHLTKSAKYYWNYKGYTVPTKRPNELNNFAGKKYRQENLIPTGDPQDRGTHSQYGGRTWRTEEDRPIRSVWSFATQGYHGKHRSVFPEKLAEICIKLASREGDVVLDPFCGTGTVLWVAKKLGRRGLGYELGQKYIEMARERTAQMTTEEL